MRRGRERRGGERRGGRGGRRGEERMRGMDGRGGEGRRGRWFQPITLILCVGMEVPCKPS